MHKAMLALSLVLASCRHADDQSYLSQEMRFVQLGVQLGSEEREVRRVLAQRGLRLVSRVEHADFIALGAASKDRTKSAVRVITRRGVEIADDASADDLFAPGTVTLIEHFGGEVGPYLLAAEARIAAGNDAGCVTLYRILPDGTVVACPIDLSPLGSRACVSNLAPAAGGHMHATIAWPSLRALATPELSAEIAFSEPPLGQTLPLTPVAHLAPGPWLDVEQRRVSTLRLSRADFSRRHAAGVARAAIALLTGKDRATQLDAYRNAVSDVLPGTIEAQAVAETTAHIERGWLDPDDGSAPPSIGAASPDPVLDDPDVTVVEPPAPP